MRAPSLLSFIIIIAVCSGCQTGTNLKPDKDPRKIEMLFLGHDSDHHNSEAYLPILAAALAPEAINFTYSDDPEILADREELSKYDGLVLYANHDEITPAQEAGLLGFIAGGKGFLPLHSASFCFRNSEEFVQLVGAQFKEHGTGVFGTTITNKDHFITAELDTFSTWDETYVHDLHNEDRTVLMVREENGKSEPWTWVREYGKGRVFYTAYGHDERTWSNPGFQELVKKGILWAVGDRVRNLWQSYREQMPELQYRDNAGPIPNYEKRDPAPRFQDPLSPQESHKLMQVPPGFRLELFASEPDIINPIAMDWDEKGRLWVVETIDYPNTVREIRTVGDDRIKICEDTDGDGRADKFTIFADQLNIPTSMAFVNGGVLISQAPYFIFLKDEDGDDRADVREIVMNGWGTYDTHAGPSNLQYGLDNKIWGVVGYSGFEGNIAGAELRFRQGIYRFSRQFDNFEFLTRTSNNTWGLGFTEENDVFASTANNTHHVFMSIPDRYFAGVSGIPLIGNTKIDGHYAMHPITPNFRQVDVFGGFTAAAGHHFYTARDYPEEYHNRIAFVCEPTGGLVHKAVLEKQGAGFVEKDGWNLLASADEWVSPVEAKVGPDGQVWIADWYNFIIQHNPTPTPERGGFKGENGAGNAHVNPLRDKAHGRIWRVVYENASPGKLQSLDQDNAGQLVAALSSDNRFWRMTAQRLLVERSKDDVASKLTKLVTAAPGLPALHAIWTLDGLDLIEREDIRPLVEQAIRHPAAAVRRAAIQILGKRGLLQPGMLDAKLKEERSPEVQLAILLAIADQPASPEMGTALYRLSQRKEIDDDPYLAKAAYVAASKHRAGFIAAYQEDHPGFREALAAELPLQAPDYDDSAWKKMTLPQSIEQAGMDIDGEVWFRAILSLTAAEAQRGIELHLGPIDDSDETWVNGNKVGETIEDWQAERIYPVPARALQEGDNYIAIRMEDQRGSGGLYGNEEQFYYVAGSSQKPLPKEWKYKVTRITRSAGNELFMDESFAEAFVKAYWQQQDPQTAAGAIAADQTIEIGVIKNEMKYNLNAFTVTAGQTVSIVFRNEDFMQHNLIIGPPGSLEIIGAAADKMAMDPKGSEQEYIPNIPQVLFHTRLVNPNESVTLTFQVPDEPGEYPFVCTFPGHWRIMNGTMKVVSKKSI